MSRKNKKKNLKKKAKHSEKKSEKLIGINQIIFPHFFLFFALTAFVRSSVSSVCFVARAPTSYHFPFFFFNIFAHFHNRNEMCTTGSHTYTDGSDIIYKMLASNKTVSEKKNYFHLFGDCGSETNWIIANGKRIYFNEVEKKL